ncbi:hypothetical protein F1D61_09255 [Methylobacterium aquaticum]|nr:hypothetical protein F1D61_09255 [Methylobacterium aquaticum]
MAPVDRFQPVQGCPEKGVARVSPLPAGGERAVFPFREHSEASAEGEGVFPEEPHSSTPPHPRFGCASACSIDDEVDGALSPPAGRGEARAILFSGQSAVP